MAPRREGRQEEILCREKSAVERTALWRGLHGENRSRREGLRREKSVMDKCLHRENRSVEKKVPWREVFVERIFPKRGEH
jgi:hypothetical protein